MSDLCEFRNGSIQINLSTDILRFASEAHPDFWDGESGTDVPNIKITDLDRFALEVVRQINKEDPEDGSTMLTRMFDSAIKAAVEDGCEGVDHD